MKKSATIFGSAALALLGAHVLGATPDTPPVSPKKQLAACMTRQMSASRTLSYYDAMKVCKDLIKSQEDSLVASNAAKPAHAR